MQCVSHGVHNATHQDWVHRETHPGDPQLQQSHPQGREELNKCSQGRLICHLAPAIPVGNRSSLSLEAILKQETKNLQQVEKNWQLNMQHCRKGISCAVPAPVSIPHPLQMHSLFHINTVQTVKRTATEHASSESENMDPLAKKKRQNQNRRPNPSTPAVYSSIIHKYHHTSLQLESLNSYFFSFYIFFLKKEIRQHKHWDPPASFFLQSKAFVFSRMIWAFLKD